MEGIPLDEATKGLVDDILSADPIAALDMIESVRRASITALVAFVVAQLAEHGDCTNHDPIRPKLLNLIKTVKRSYITELDQMVELNINANGMSLTLEKSVNQTTYEEILSELKG